MCYLGPMANSTNDSLQVGAVVILNSDTRTKPQLMSLEVVDEVAKTGTATWFDYNNGLRREAFPLAILKAAPVVAD